MVKTNEELVLEVLNLLSAILHDVCTTETLRAYAEKWVLLGYDAAAMKVADEVRLLRCGMPEGYAFKVHRHFHSSAGSANAGGAAGEGYVRVQTDTLLTMDAGLCVGLGGVCWAGGRLRLLRTIAARMCSYTQRAAWARAGEVLDACLFLQVPCAFSPW